MEYRNDEHQFKVAAGNYLHRMLLLITLSFLWTMFTLTVTMQGIPNAPIIISATFLAGLMGVSFGLVLSYRRFKRDYFQYSVDVTENTITVTSAFINQTLTKNSIEKILEDKNGTVTLRSGNRKSVGISKYIKDHESLIQELKAIKDIEKIKQRIDYINILQIVCFCGLFLTRFIPDYRLYLTLAFGFVITTVISITRMCFSSTKKRYIIYPIIIYGIFLILISRNIIILLSKSF